MSTSLRSAPEHDAFWVYVEQGLAPTLSPGDVVVLDNLGSLPVTELGSGLIDHNQKMTAAAMAMAEKKVCAHLS